MRPDEKSNWQPISELPLVGHLIRRLLLDAEEQYQSLVACRSTPHVLDDSTIHRVQRLCLEGKEDFRVHQEQLATWKKGRLTPDQREAIADLGRVLGRAKSVSDSVLALAEELSHGTIDKSIAGSDMEPGIEAILGVLDADGGKRPLSGVATPPLETSEDIESKRIPCDHCGTMVAMLIFAPEATDDGRFEDYARKMHPQYVRLNQPTWIIGPDLGDGPPMDLPADILKVWPEREPLRRWTPEEFNVMLDRLVDGHCPPARRKAGKTRNVAPPDAETLARVARIDARMLGLLRDDCDELTILTRMVFLMPDFKRVLDAMIDSTGPAGWEELCKRYAGFARFAQIYEAIALGIQANDIPLQG